MIVMFGLLVRVDRLAAALPSSADPSGRFVGEFQFSAGIAVKVPGAAESADPPGSVSSVGEEEVL